MIRTSDDRLPNTLHWALAVLILLEGSVNLAHGFSGDHDAQLLSFGAAEVLGAALFAWSRTIAAGACVLVCGFLIAAGVHVLGHDWPFEHLIYAVAVLLVLAHHRLPHDATPPAA